MIASEIFFLFVGVTLSAFCFLALDIRHRKDIKPIQERLKALEDLYNSMNINTIASFKYYDESIRNLKPAPKAPEKDKETLDTLVFMDNQIQEIRSAMLVHKNDLTETWLNFRDKQQTENLSHQRKLTNSLHRLAAAFLSRGIRDVEKKKKRSRDGSNSVQGLQEENICPF